MISTKLHLVHKAKRISEHIVSAE